MAPRLDSISPDDERSSERTCWSLSRIAVTPRRVSSLLSREAPRPATPGDHHEETVHMKRVIGILGVVLGMAFTRGALADSGGPPASISYANREAVELFRGQFLEFL